MGIEEKLKALPDAPGVYLMKDKQGHTLYIGKAQSLRKRLRSYFQRTGMLSPRTQAMVSKITGFDFIQTSSEAEALIYEAHLVKVHRPKYNVDLKDDKAYPFLKLTSDEDFPRLVLIRRRKSDGAMYFGPYTSVKLLRQALGIMRKAFPLRTCKRLPKNVCLMFHLGQCLGPCEKKADEKEYREVIKDLLLFLEGKRDELLAQLSDKMTKASEDKNYEEAGKIRDRINALSSVITRRKRIKVSEQIAQLEEALGLAHAPMRIDAFDISNVFGNWAVGSMVQFTDGAPNKANYRRFKIESVDGIDDYKMTKEIIRRRYLRCLDEKIPLPDLIIIDGGRG
ncbi:MAG: excinuclease ABC subunit UvrC, partial [Candidatus Omnitrophota bacterium]